MLPSDLCFTCLATLIIMTTSISSPRQQQQQQQDGHNKNKSLLRFDFSSAATLALTTAVANDNNVAAAATPPTTLGGSLQGDNIDSDNDKVIFAKFLTNLLLMNKQHNEENDNDYSSKHPTFCSTEATMNTGGGRRAASRRRAARKSVPDECKDQRYFERRARNNYAAKKSRDTRKAREDTVAYQAEQLERLNQVLRAKVTTLREEAQSLRALVARKKHEQQQHRASRGSLSTKDSNFFFKAAGMQPQTFSSSASSAMILSSSMQTSPVSPLAPLSVRQLLGCYSRAATDLPA